MKITKAFLEERLDDKAVAEIIRGYKKKTVKTLSDLLEYYNIGRKKK